MTTIGVYDSGIGGLTTLAKLIIKFQHCDFLLYADNSHFPLGSLDNKRLAKTVEKGISHLEKKCDFVVLACNTASSITTNQKVFKLLPPINDFLPKSTLVLATPKTIQNLRIKEKGYATLETTELASLITKMMTENDSKQSAYTEIELLLRNQLLSTKPAESVLIGCSHYIFIEDMIKKISGCDKVFDGNAKLIFELSKVIAQPTGIGVVNFEFSGKDQSEQYLSILENLLYDYHKL